MEYRPFPEERADEFRAFMRYAFSPEQGPYDPEADDDDREHLADYRGLFDGDEPVAVCGHHDFTLRIRGSDRDVAGLSAVASPPEHRRQGNIERILRESLAEYRDDDVHVSVLWPFEYGFYRKYGWATVSRYRYLRTPPDQLGFVDDAVRRSAGDGDERGRFRRLGADDYAAAEPVLSSMADRYDFTMARTEAWWRERTLRGWKTDPFVYGWERGGELRAFWSYVFDDDPDDVDVDGTVMTVRDVATIDEEAWLHVLRFCRDHDSQVEEVRIRAPPDANLQDRVPDPRAVTVESRTGPMLRLVDVAGAFEALEPDPELDSRFTLAVADPLVTWNDRTFRVDVADGTVSVEPVAGADDPNSSADSLDDTVDIPDATVGIGTLSQLYAGYHSVQDAAEYGDLAVSDARTGDDDPSATDDAVGDLIADLNDLFPPRKTFLREGF